MGDEIKATPGPWRVGGWDSDNSEGERNTEIVARRPTGRSEAVATVHHQPGSFLAECEANARLIAAAPEMLEALNLSALVIHAPHALQFHECPDSVCKQNRAAISKAGGE